MKKVISIFTLVVLVGFYAVSLFAHENCGMLRTTETASHCGMDMADMDCCSGAKECVTVALHPVSSAPLNKVEVQKDITSEVLVSHSIFFEVATEYSEIELTKSSPPPDIYLGFQTPLLA